MSKFKLPTKHEIKTFVEKHKAEIATVGAVTALTVIYAVTPRNAQTPTIPTTPATPNTQEWTEYHGISDCGQGMVILTEKGSDKLQRGESLHVQTDNPDLAVLITEAPKTEATTATE